MLDQVTSNIHSAPLRTKSSMNNFIYTVATSYLPLHEKALEIAKAVGPVEFKQEKGKTKTLNALENIEKFMVRGKLGFKRRHVRC